MKRYKMPITGRKNISKDVVEIQLDALGSNFDFKPGQHVRVYVAKSIRNKVADQEFRIFSIVSEPGSGKVSFAFCVKGAVSEFKTKLLSLPLGSNLSLSQPSGIFAVPQDSNSTLVFLAAGVGITAFMSKLKVAVKANSTRRIILMWSITRESEAPYISEVRRIEKMNSSITLITRITSVDGRIDGEFISVNVPDILNARWQLAGPQDAVLHYQYTIDQLGVNSDNIQSEIYSGYGLKDEEGDLEAQHQPFLSRNTDDRRLQGLLDAFNGVAIISETDLDGTILFVNDKFVEVSKYTRDELLGQNHRILKSGHHPPKFFRNLWDTIAAGKVWRGEIKNRAKDGTYYWVDTSIAPVFDANGRLVKYASVRVVITDKKKADEELVLYGQKLESMVEEKTKEITSTNDILKREIQRRQLLEDQLQARAKKLAESDRKKDEFIAVLSHELRNPMTPIVMSLDLIRSRTIEDKQLVSYIGIIDRQIKNMNRIMNDLLDVSRVLRGKIELRLQETDIQDVVLRSIETTKPLIDECRHEMTIELQKEKILSMADSVRMEQVFVNLINNAAKYTDNGGHIRIKLWSDKKNTYFLIKDTGIGISSEEKRKIFSLFVQADNSLTRKRGGLGIGLALSSSIVKMHGGKIKAESAGPGKGSEFVATFPLIKDDFTGNTRKRDSTTSSLKKDLTKDKNDKKKVLIVDDVPEITSTLSALLSASGFDTFTANDGESGIKKAVRFKPDFVLLDIAMPGMDGYQTLTQMKQSMELDKTSYIAITGFGQKNDYENSLKAGFDAHLVKPVSLEVLKKTFTKIGGSSIK